MILAQELIARYDLNGPRYTSYPSADHFSGNWSEKDYQFELQQRAEHRRDDPLSIYIHIPFCENICYYCACNKIITKDHRRSAQYVTSLIQEMDQVIEQLGHPSCLLQQIHLGGGTPTFLSDEELGRIMTALKERFQFSSQGEYSIEIDPRHARTGTIAYLRQIGFNRMSLGVQDFDEKVQQAVHRVQPVQMTLSVLEEARAQGFTSINMDLIYGLPFQTLDSFSRTLARVIEAHPDRIALYNYAHLPHAFAPQRRIDEATLPPGQLKIELLAMAVQTLTDAGYLYIGMDHFALPQDELARAQSEKRLERNFQGYSIYPQFDLIGLGVSAIGKVGRAYVQNVKTLEAYYDRLDQGRLATYRGFRLTFDDLLRRKVIQSLMCNFELEMIRVDEEFGIDFEAYFEPELNRMQEFLDAGFLKIANRMITVATLGRYFIRPICMLFDVYLEKKRDKPLYSRTI
ncbi:MAG: oxygen-independent coproporphyrinogen III oxidase [Proteobacteria bacterium]|nr:oxygen-independent coproporphyrinogen III oxidase [Pseudomonadota bacterium]